MAYRTTTTLEFYDHREIASDEHNSFRRQAPDRTPPPTFAASKARLPQPFWDGARGSKAIATYWKAWELAFVNLRAPTPENGFVAPYIDTAFNDCVFEWDSSFILMFARYGSRAFAFQRTLDNLYCKQHVDGFISREIHESDGRDQFHRHDPISTGPNVLAWCEWEHYCNFADKARLRRVFPVLLGYHEWMRKHRTWPDGSYHSCGLACGMDNQPRVLPGDNALTDHSWTAWVDATAQALLSARILVLMFEELGAPGRYAGHIHACRAEVGRLATYMQEHMWNAETQSYADRRLQSSVIPALSSTRTIGSYWALLAGIVPEARLAPFVAALDDVTLFNRPVRVPSLAARDPHYRSDGGYWLGGVWAPTTYMVLRGLTLTKQSDLAADIGANYHDSVVKIFQNTGSIWENVAPELVGGEPVPGEPSKRDFVGWSGLGPVAVLFEYVFGFRADVPRGTLTIDVRLLERYGVTAFPFGDADIDIEVAARSSVDVQPIITVRSPVPIRVILMWGSTAIVKGGVPLDPARRNSALKHESVVMIAASPAAAARVIPVHPDASAGRGGGSSSRGRGRRGGSGPRRSSPRSAALTMEMIDAGLAEAFRRLGGSPP